MRFDRARLRASLRASLHRGSSAVSYVARNVFVLFHTYWYPSAPGFAPLLARSPDAKCRAGRRLSRWGGGRCGSAADFAHERATPSLRCGNDRGADCSALLGTA